MTRARAYPGTHPSQLPSIRDWIREQLLPGGWLRLFLDTEENKLAGIMKRPTTNSNVELSINDAKIFWVPEAECDIIANANVSLPDDLTISEDDVPYPSGFAVLEKPFVGINGTTGELMPIATKALRWGPIMLLDDDRQTLGPAMSMSSWSFELDSLGREWWVPLGRTDWLYGQKWNEYFSDSPALLASVCDDRARFMALWALMNTQEPLVYRPTRAEMRRDTRIAPMSVDRFVNVVKWDAHRYEREHPVSHSGRKVHVRYHVDGFYRRTAYGPGRSLRRWQYIPPHWRGPEDAPVKGKTITVNKVGS